MIEIKLQRMDVRKSCWKSYFWDIILPDGKILIPQKTKKEAMAHAIKSYPNEEIKFVRIDGD